MSYWSGIAFGGHHHADRRPRVPLQRRQRVELAVHRGVEQVQQIGLQPHQQRLALRIAEANIELQHLGTLEGHHHAGIQHAAKRPPGTVHGMNGRHEDVLFDPGEFFVVDQGGRAIGAHAAGVRADVAVVGRLVVLGRLQGDDRAAVGNRQHAGLLAVEPFFNHQAIAGGAEDFLQGNLLDGANRLVAIGANHHALAGRQTVGLDDDAAVVPLVQVMNRFRRIAEDLVVGGGNVGRVEQILAKDLAALEFRRGLAGTEDPQALRLEGIDDSGGQRALRADDGQPHVVVPGEADQGRKIVGRIGTFSPSMSVPALPGATKTRSARGLCEIFQARACSRPPLPTMRTFMCQIPGES